ncbi:MAG: nucleotidyltransferase family protein [Candidatus Aminicenantes bacterium]|nr:nucleotidyltransferase family protein [Candidatus Aminicenantes bacterium]
MKKKRRGMIWAIVLAAGESRRMGQPKLLLPFGRSTIIETVVQSLMESSLDGILVVLGHRGQGILDKLKNYAVETTVNPHYQRGMLSSVQWGFRKLPRDAGAALVILGDQPGVSAQTIDLIIGAFKSRDKGIVLPTYKDSGGHPLLVDIKYRREIRSLDPAVGLRSLLSRHPDDILRVEVRDTSVLQDIDNPGDYRKARTGKD